MRKARKVNFYDADLVDYFKDAESKDLVDQRYGDYKAGSPCCVGAHLANFLKVTHLTQGSMQHFLGANEWAGRCGGNKAHAILLLREAGAGYDPFDGSNWLCKPSEVFETLKGIEELPLLVGADLSDVNLSHANLRYSDKVGASMEGANLRGANLTYSDLTGANLRGADLEDACLDNTDLDKADLTGANLMCATFRNTSFNRANLTDAYLYGTDMSNATFRNTVIDGVVCTDAKFPNSYEGVITKNSA